MCPPLRKKSDNQSLWKGLERDIDTVATDHCAFFFSSQKMKGKDDFTKCPAGIPGVEERLSLLFSEGVLKNRISLRRFTELCMTNPAKIFGLYPRKGVIREGSDADIAIIDPDKKVTLSKQILHANTDYSVYEGITLNAYTVYTISRGEVIVRDGELSAIPGRGVFLKRGTSGWKTLM
jgi:dihydropyrimidinase